MIAALAWVLALTIGLSLWWLAAGRPRGHAGWLSAAGHAVLLGLVACALVVRLPAAFGVDALSVGLWLWPALLLVPLAALAWRTAPASGLAKVPDPKPASLWWLWLLLALIALRTVWLYEEAWLRPLFGWDAWLAWSAKAKAWILAGQALPFVPGEQWLTQSAGSARTSLAHHYPELLSWVQVWLASAAGGWHEPAVNLAWPTLWLALLAGCYGQWRALAVPVLPATVGTYVLASLPLANVHAALPGYADLWLATAFVFAVLALLRWRAHADLRQLGLALALTALLPALKFEGMIWAAGLVALMLWYGLAGHGRVVRLLAALFAVLGLLWVSWWWQLAWLDTLIILFAGTPAGTGSSVAGVLTATAAGLFAQDNWHLLWYLLPIVVAWRWRTLRSSPGLTGLALLLAGGLVLLLVLFLFSQAGRWAESFTVINRLVLQLAPIAVTLMVLLASDRTRTGVAVGLGARRGTAPVSD